MALIECPECKREISSEAISCPHCGYPLRRNIETNQSDNVVNVKIVQEEKKKPNYSNSEIEKYEREMNDYRSRSKTNGNAGGIILFLALLMIIGGIVCIAIGYEYDLYVLGYVLIAIGGVALDGAIALLVMSSVFSKKADNREKLINEHNKKQYTEWGIKLWQKKK